MLKIIIYIAFYKYKFILIIVTIIFCDYYLTQK